MRAQNVHIHNYSHQAELRHFGPPRPETMRKTEVADRSPCDLVHPRRFSTHLAAVFRPPVV